MWFVAVLLPSPSLDVTAVAVSSRAEQHKDDDLDKVIALLLSYITVQSKAKLEHVYVNGLPVSNAESQFYKVLNSLTTLEAKCVFFFSSFFLPLLR
jgi:hypothetical protein